MATSSIAHLRKEYRNASLSEQDVLKDPIQQFALWFDNALEAKVLEPNAMTLATASKKGIPSARIVLLKGFDPEGFIFYTNYESHKGKELKENPHAALVFFWHDLERQVRIEGKIKKVKAGESDLYFHSRPKESRLGAWASPQSQVIEDRQILEETFEELVSSYEHTEPPRPDFWGGYRLIPNKIEFWQGRPSRMHDRILFKKSAKGNWKVVRLAP
jgi:pyridoxamine 5'-phosphate oxidase